MFRWETHIQIGEFQTKTARHATIGMQHSQQAELSPCICWAPHHFLLYPAKLFHRSFFQKDEMKLDGLKSKVTYWNYFFVWLQIIPLNWFTEISACSVESFTGKTSIRSVNKDEHQREKRREGWEVDLNDEVMDRTTRLGRRLCCAHLYFQQLLRKDWRRKVRWQYSELWRRTIRTATSGKQLS